MKLLKQILIYIVFTGVIYGVFTLVTKEKEVVNTAALSAGNHEQMIAEIDRDWNGLRDWDEEIYRRHNTMVAQSLNAGIINDLDSRALKDRINKAAYQKCITAMNREFDRPDCDASVLADNYGGLQTVLINERGLAHNSRIIDVTKVYNLYNRIIAFNKRSLNMSPRFNGDNGTWNHWAAHQDKITGQKHTLVNDPHFSRISHITAVRDIYNTDNRLSDARKKFYNGLSGEMRAYYNGKKRQIEEESVTEAEKSARMADLRKKINGIRAQIANDKYVNPAYPIFNQLYDLIRQM